MESTSDISDGCDLLYTPTSTNAVTKQNIQEGFLIRKEGFFKETPTSPGCRRT